MENQEVVDRIIEGSLDKDGTKKDRLSLRDFFKCIATLTNSDFT